MSTKDRKWKLAIWGMVLGTVIALVAVAGWVVNRPGAAGILAQGLGIVTLVFGAYAAANVSQKSIIGKNYVPELDDRKGEVDE